MSVPQSDIITQWQSAINSMADILDVPGGYIMRFDGKELEVLVSSETKNNPIELGAKFILKDSGLYCERVIDNQEKLQINNAEQSQDWKDSPGVSIGLPAYLGFPIRQPNGDIFGTICIMDSKENNFSDKFVNIVLRFKCFIEQDLKLIDERNELQKINDELIKEREKLAHATKMAALGEMAAGIAHEINNPLSIIQSYAYRINSAIENRYSTDKEIKDLSQNLEETVIRAAKIIKGLMNVSQDKSDKDYEDCSLMQIYSDTLMLCNEKFNSKNIDFSISNEHNEEVLHCNNVQISEVILNILNNAFDAIKETSSPWIKIWSKLSKDQIIIYIQDNGEGIPDKILKNMFTPFFTTKDIGKGTGLGMSISKGIVNAHQGQLKYELIDGHTTFLIELPIKE